jgi:hypothetical protein
MTESPRQQIERILGGKVTPFDEQELPGLVPSEGAEVVYFSDFEGTDLGVKMRTLTRKIDPPLIKHGGVATTSHTLSLPDGQLFHAIKYRGDLEGWRRQIAGGAEALGVQLGRIENGTTFVLSDGRTFALAQCRHAKL